MSDIVEQLRSSLLVDFNGPGQPKVGGSCHGIMTSALSEIERLRAALEKAAYTFGDLRKGFTMMQKPLLVASCEIAERGCRAALASPQPRAGVPASTSTTMAPCGCAVTTDGFGNVSHIWCHAHKPAPQTAEGK